MMPFSNSLLVSKLINFLSDTEYRLDLMAIGLQSDVKLLKREGGEILTAVSPHNFKGGLLPPKGISKEV